MSFNLEMKFSLTMYRNSDVKDQKTHRHRKIIQCDFYNDPYEWYQQLNKY